MGALISLGLVLQPILSSDTAAVSLVVGGPVCGTGRVLIKHPALTVRAGCHICRCDNASISSMCCMCTSLHAVA